MNEFKALICRSKGNWNDPTMTELRSQIKRKEMLKSCELGSWKQVLDRYGWAVSCAALRQGTLPYVPHSLLKPGHGVAWPEDHEFIRTKSMWTTVWRTEVGQTATGPKSTHDIEAFLAQHDRGMKDNNLPDNIRTAPRAVPQAPADSASPAVETPTDSVRAAADPYWQQNWGPDYDEAHNTALTNIPKAITEWQQKKPRFRGRNCQSRKTFHVPRLQIIRDHQGTRQKLCRHRCGHPLRRKRHQNPWQRPPKQSPPRRSGQKV